MSEQIIAMPVDWLLEEGPPWVQYWTRRELLGQSPDVPAVIAAHDAVVAHHLVQTLVAECTAWPGDPLNRHNDAKHLLHKLSTLAEFGLTAADEALAPVIERVLAHQSPEGAFTVNMTVHERFGGDGKAHDSWMACDAPTVLFALIAFGLSDHPQVQRAIIHMTDLIDDNGWRCKVAETFGDFRGPGRKGDPCPYATLIALKALSRLPAEHHSEAALTGIETLLWHWQIQKERKLYLFGIGTDFRKPKFPLIWYDMVHVVDVLSRFPDARSDPRFTAMIADLMARADANSRFTAQSMYMAWKGWDFANKKAPSPTITATVWRAWQRTV